MKKQTLEGISDAFRRTKPDHHRSAEAEQWLADVMEVAKILKKYNDFFSYDTFYIECGIEPLNLKVRTPEK